MTPGSSPAEGRASCSASEPEHDPSPNAAEPLPLLNLPTGYGLDDIADDPTAPDPADPADPADTVDAEDTAESDQADAGLRWDIVREHPEDPFSSQLVLTEAGHTLLWWTLDPVTVRELTAALAQVKGDQLAALTGHPATTGDHPDPATPEPAPAVDTEPTKRRSWAARHKIATVFLAFLAVVFVWGFLTGGAHMTG